MGNGYRITIEGEDLSFETQVGFQTALDVLARVKGQPRPAEPERGARGPDADHSDASHPVQRWMERARPRNNFERIAVLAAYFEDEMDQEGVRWEDVRPWFERAGEDPPVNLGRDLRKAEERGLIEEVEERLYRATQEGRRVAGVA